MPNFIDDDTALPAAKVDRRPIPPGESATKFWQASDSNAVFSALEDTRDAVQALQAAAGGSLGTIHQAGYGGIDATLTDLATGGKRIVQIRAGDDTSTFVSGIDATGFNDGDLLLVLNHADVGDAGSLIFLYEDVNSTAANRFVTPDRRPYKQGHGGLILVRAPLLDGAGAATTDHRWHIVGTIDHEKVGTQNLQFYPPLNVGTVTPISGTINNWNPTGDQYQSYTHGLDGSDNVWKNHSLIRVGVNAAGATITGMYVGDDVSLTDLDKHDLKIIMNFGSGSMTFKHLNGSSSTDNQIQCPFGQDFELASGESAIFIWHTKWQVISGPNRYLAPRRVVVSPSDASVPALSVTPATGHINPVTIQDSLTGQVVSGGVRRNVFSQVSGTFDLTGGDLGIYGVIGQVTATKSAGSGSLTNIGVYGNASGGLVNYAGLFDGPFRQAGGDVVLNGGSGTTTIVGACTLSSTLKVTGNIGFYNTAPGAKPTVSGSRGGNAALASLITALANLGLITDSTSA